MRAAVTPSRFKRLSESDGRNGLGSALSRPKSLRHVYVLETKSHTEDIVAISATCGSNGLLCPAVLVRTRRDS